MDGCALISNYICLRSTVPTTRSRALRPEKSVGPVTVTKAARVTPATLVVPNVALVPTKNDLAPTMPKDLISLTNADHLKRYRPAPNSSLLTSTPKYYSFYKVYSGRTQPRSWRTLWGIWQNQRSCGQNQTRKHKFLLLYRLR